MYEDGADDGRRNMRKGTRSCTECNHFLALGRGAGLTCAGRRRKIRCSFAADGTTCLRCTKRGLRCVKQSRDNVPNFTARTVHEQISVLEAMLQGKSRQGEGNVADTTPADDADIEIIGYIDQTPFSSLLGGVSPISVSAQHDPSSQPAEPSEVLSAQAAKVGTIRRSYKSNPCEILRSYLPPFDTLAHQIEESNTSWWTDWRQKVFGSCVAAESLASYAARVFCSFNVGEVAILVTAYARTVPKFPARYFAFVEGVVLTNESHAASIDGLECIVLLSKCYLDFGQPRRAWLATRRGITLAQLTGFNRHRNFSLRGNAIWWSLYHGDRFTSLTLGLPYAVHDAQLEPLEGVAANSSIHGRTFLLKCAKAAGQIIDRNQSSNHLNPSITASIYESIESTGRLMPEAWWDLPRQLEAHEMNSVRERVLMQIYFFHVLMHCHLPFVASLSILDHSEGNGQPLFYAARELTKRYVFLRETTTQSGDDLFDCKVNDFLGFISALVLALNLPRTGPLEMKYNQDYDLVRAVLRQLKRLMDERYCKMLSQCHSVLTRLLEGQGQMEAKIPYFGKVCLKCRATQEEGGWTGSSDEVVNAQTARSGWEYLGLELTVVPNVSGVLDGSDLDMLHADLDDDWTQFLDSHNSTSYH